MHSWLNRNLLYRPVSAIQAGPVDRHLRTLVGREREDPQVRDARRLEALRGLLAHASDHVPHYRCVLAGSDVQGIASLSALTELPFLSKSDLQSRKDSLRSEAPVGHVIQKTTGGSTGEPVTVLKSRDAWAWELAATWRGYSWAGVAMGDLQARFWGVPHQSKSRWRASLIDLVCNRIRFPAFKFAEADLHDYHRIIRRKRPRYFYGYVSMLREFAEFMQRRGLTLESPPAAVITTSEVLTDPTRELLQTVFAAPVFDEYGCGELGTIAHECPAGSLHLSEENMLVEILAGDRPAAPGESGEIVVTELNNLAMPMIRYRTGDFGMLKPRPCACGRTLTVLGNIHGRAYDFVEGPDGRRFHGEFMMYIFEDIRRQGPGIRQFQCIQETPTRFRIRIVPEPGAARTYEELIRARLREHIHPDVEVAFEDVEAITRERSGKMRLIVGMAPPRDGAQAS